MNYFHSTGVNKWNLISSCNKNTNLDWAKIASPARLNLIKHDSHLKFLLTVKVENTQEFTLPATNIILLTFNKPFSVLPDGKKNLKHLNLHH